MPAQAEAAVVVATRRGLVVAPPKGIEVVAKAVAAVGGVFDTPKHVQREVAQVPPPAHPRREGPVASGGGGVGVVEGQASLVRQRRIRIKPYERNKIEPGAERVRRGVSGRVSQPTV